MNKPTNHPTTNRQITHAIPVGHSVNVVGGLVGLFGPEIAAAMNALVKTRAFDRALKTSLKGRCSDANHANTTAVAAGYTDRPRAAGGQGAGVVRAFALPERQIRDVQQVDGGPVAGQVYAFHRKPAAGVEKNTRPLT